MPSIENQEMAAVEFNQQAENLLAQSRLDEAIAACEAALKVQADFVPACKTMGKALQAQGKLNEAYYWYEKALAITPENAEIHANIGSLYAQQKQWKQAILSYEKAIFLQPNFAGVHRNLARIFSQLNQPGKAADCWYQALMIDPHWATAEEHLTLGNTLVEQQKFEQACICYRRAVEFKPNFGIAHHNLGEVLTQLGRIEEGIGAYCQAIKVNPEFSGFHHSLGKALAAQGQWDDAIASYRQALNLDSNYSQVYYNLGEALAKKGELDEAISIYQKAIQFQPQSWEPHEKLGEVLSKKLQFEAAIDAYKRAIELNPSAFLSYHQLVQTFFKLKQWEEAATNARRTIEIYPNLPWPYTQLGNALVELGQLEEAAVCHQKASEVRGWHQCLEKGYQFTRDWFTHNIPIWEKHLKLLVGGSGIKALEIGSFQGMSACWLLDNVLTDSAASITCIEPNFQEQFDGNIAKTGAGEKVRKLEALSYQVLGDLEADAYELVYIDGCHLAASVLEDAILSWRLVKVGGLIIFDDYEWAEPETLILTTKIGIDTFLSMFKNQVELIHKGYQLIVKKIAPEVPKEFLEDGGELLSFRACTALADALAEQGDLDAASDYYRQAIELQNGVKEEVHQQLGKILKEQGQSKLNPDCFPSYCKLGEILLKLEKYSEAVSVYSHAIELNPDSFWCYNQLGNALIKMERYSEAVPILKGAIELNLEFTWCYFHLGLALLKLERFSEAVVPYRRAIELDPNIAAFHYNLGETLANLQQWPEAVAAYRCALELEPDNMWLYKTLGDALQKQGQIESAIAIYQKAIELQPQCCWIYEGLGQILMEQQQWEEAIACFIKALQIKPDFFEIYDHLAEIWQQQGDWQEAAECKILRKLPKKLIKKYCQITEALTVTSQSDPSITRINVYPASQVQFSPSKTLDDSVICEFQACQAPLNELSVAVLQNARAWADLGNTAVITSDDKLVTDFSTGCGELILSSDKLPPPVEIDGTVAFLSVKFCGSVYFHWMFDLVSRFDLLEKSGIDLDSIAHFVVSRQHFNYQKESLSLLGIPPSKIIDSSIFPHIKAKTLIVPTLPYQGGYEMLSKWSCEFLKKTFLRDSFNKNIGRPKRLYISRQRANYRKIRNHEAVLSLLEKYEFETVFLETMSSVEEQASYLAAAEMVVAPHGSGLTNLVFCRPGTKVIEFFFPKYVPNCYWIISNVCGLEHYYLMGEMFEDDSNSPLEADILVNLEQLEALLKIAGVAHD